MSEFLITSDEHIHHGGHDGKSGIITLAKRPFANVDEMEETIIARHNEIARDNTTTVHVGDWFWNTFGVERAMAHIKRLRGRHGFLFGNHDELIEKHKATFATKLAFIIGENEAGGAKIIQWNKKKFHLQHYACRVWPKSHKGMYHVYGHSHAGLPGLGRSLDIGVDGHNFYPWTLEEIESTLDRIEPHHYIDNTGRNDRDVVVEPKAKASRFDWP